MSSTWGRVSLMVMPLAVIELRSESGRREPGAARRPARSLARRKRDLDLARLAWLTHESSLTHLDDRASATGGQGESPILESQGWSRTARAPASASSRLVARRVLST